MRNKALSKRPLVAIDMGNTGTTIGLFHHDKLVHRHTYPTSGLRRVSFRGERAFRLPQAFVLIASVVPSQTKTLWGKIRRFRRSYRVELIGRDLEVPIPNKTRYPHEVGVDRLVNAYAAYSRYARDCIVVDFGTAITFDVVSKSGAYLGGLIAPGVEITLNALFEKTALLPRVRLVHPRALIGKSTVQSIRAGCSYGLGALCDGILMRLLRHLGQKTPVIATGGYAHYISRYSSLIRTIDVDLTLKGIYGIHKNRLTFERP